MKKIVILLGLVVSFFAIVGCASKSAAENVPAPAAVSPVTSEAVAPVAHKHVKHHRHHVKHAKKVKKEVVKQDAAKQPEAIKQDTTTTQQDEVKQDNSNQAQ